MYIYMSKRHAVMRKCTKISVEPFNDKAINRKADKEDAVDWSDFPSIYGEPSKY